MSAIHVLLDDIERDFTRDVPTLLEGELVPDSLLRKAFSALVQRLAAHVPQLFDGVLPEATVTPAPPPTIGTSAGASVSAPGGVPTAPATPSDATPPVATETSSDPNARRLEQVEGLLAEKEKLIASLEAERGNTAVARAPEVGVAATGSTGNA